MRRHCQAFRCGHYSDFAKYRSHHLFELWPARLQESTQGNNFWQATKRVPLRKHANSGSQAKSSIPQDAQDAKPGAEQAV